MLIKIAAAPTAIHMRMSARMLIPIIEQKLKDEKGCENGQGKQL